jgi:hypothetical protein
LILGAGGLRLTPNVPASAGVHAIGVIFIEEKRTTKPIHSPSRRRRNRHCRDCGGDCERGQLCPRQKRARARSTSWCGIEAEESRLLLRQQSGRVARNWLTRQSRSNRSLHQNSLLTGKLTRNFAVSGVVLQICHPINAKFQSLAVKFPKQKNREFFAANREITTLNRDQPGAVPSFAQLALALPRQVPQRGRCAR